MRAGQLKKRITLQRLSGTEDPAGQNVPAWVTVATPRANIRFLSGKEYATSARDTSESIVSIRIRARQGITAGMRVVWKDQVFDIKAVLPDAEKGEHIDLACSTGANNG